MSGWRAPLPDLSTHTGRSVSFTFLAFASFWVPGRTSVQVHLVIKSDPEQVLQLVDEEECGGRIGRCA